MAVKITAYIRNNLTRWSVKFQKFKLSLNRNAHQLTSTTAVDRYPEIFNALKKLFPHPVKILSYGCSTGEECLTLQQYFPNTTIIGAEISPTNLRKCRKLVTKPNIKFIYSDDTNLTKEGPYDIILCMSVLCRWEDTKYVIDSSEIYPFSRFEQQVIKLDKLLRPGGYLVIYNSNYRFSDSVIFPFYQTVKNPKIEESGFVDKFDRNNRKIDLPYNDCLFQKITIPKF